MNDYRFLPQNKMKDSCLVLDQAVVCVQRFQFRGQRWSQAKLIPIDSGSVLEYVSVPWDFYWRFPEIGLLSAIIHFLIFHEISHPSISGYPYDYEIFMDFSLPRWPSEPMINAGHLPERPGRQRRLLHCFSTQGRWRAGKNGRWMI